MKTCTGCGELKPYKCFHKSGKYKEKQLFQSMCKICSQEHNIKYQGRWRKKNKEHIKKYRDKWVKENKKEIAVKTREYQKKNKKRIAEQKEKYRKTNKNKIADTRATAFQKRKNKLSDPYVRQSVSNSFGVKYSAVTIEMIDLKRESIKIFRLKRQRRKEIRDVNNI